MKFSSDVRGVLSLEKAFELLVQHYSSSESEEAFASCHVAAAAGSASVGDASAGADSMWALHPTEPISTAQQSGPVSHSASITPSFSPPFHRARTATPGILVRQSDAESVGGLQK